MEENQVKPFGKLLVIGGSAGSLEVLLSVLPKFDRIDSLAIAIVLHRKNGDDNLLEELLAMKTQLPLRDVEDKTVLRQGFVYVAPPDYHLLFEHDYTLALDDSEKIHYSRPSIDASFESAADAFGAGVCALLLSGANADGAAGLEAVKNVGGKIAVQQPDSADVPFMPEQAIALTSPEILTPDEMFDWIKSLDR